MSRKDETNKGRRVRLIYTNDPYTRLKPGATGTYQHVMYQSDGRHQHSIQWDDGSTLMMIEGIDVFEFDESCDKNCKKCPSKSVCVASPFKEG